MESQTTKSKQQAFGETRLGWVWQLASQSLIFMMIITTMMLAGLSALTGGNPLEPDVFAKMPIDWTNPAEVRICLWMIGGCGAIGIALATYAIDDWVRSSILTVLLLAFWLTSVRVVEAGFAITTCVFVGSLAGWMLNKLARSSAPNVWARISGRLVVQILAVVLLLIFACQSQVSPVAMWILVPVVCVKMAIYCSGGFMRMYGKAQSEIAAGDSQNRMPIPESSIA